VSDAAGTSNRSTGARSTQALPSTATAPSTSSGLHGASILFATTSTGTSRASATGRATGATAWDHEDEIGLGSQFEETGGQPEDADGRQVRHQRHRELLEAGGQVPPAGQARFTRKPARMVAFAADSIESGTPTMMM
jgi:hypothetical protein